jgi:hypothetical protein
MKARYPRKIRPVPIVRSRKINFPRRILPTVTALQIVMAKQALVQVPVQKEREDLNLTPVVRVGKEDLIAVVRVHSAMKARYPRKIRPVPIVRSRKINFPRRILPTVTAQSLAKEVQAWEDLSLTGAV